MKVYLGQTARYFPQPDFPFELWDLINHEAWNQILNKSKGGKVRLTDPEGTDVSFTFPPGQLHYPPGDLSGKLPIRATASIAMDDPFDSLLSDPGLDPIGVALREPKHQGRLGHRHLPSKDPLDNFHSLLLSHRQD